MRRPFAGALLVALLLGTGAFGGAAGAEDEPPSLARALYLEKTARDPAAALAVFRALHDAEGLDPATRAEGRLGAARCYLALGRGEEAVSAWRRLEEDAAAPTTAKEEARARREEHLRARSAAAESEAETSAREAMRRAEEARVEREGRIAAARRLVDAASGHVRAKRYEQAREALLQALQIQPNDERAAALLEEVGGYADRGELLRQAIRFVSTNRVTDWRRLVAEVDSLRRDGLRLLREEKPHLAARPFREAVARIDEGDFWTEMSDTRREIMVLLRKALDDAKAKGLRPETDVQVPADRPEAPPGPKAWRGEFFALLGRIFTSGADPGASVRFFDAAVAPDPAPESRGGGFSASGIAATPAPGSLRRARWIERFVRDDVAPGAWSGADRLLERYDDLLVVQHTAGVLRDVDALVGSFPQGPPPPTTAEIRVYAAEPGGVAEIMRLFEPKVGPSDPPGVVVVRGRRIDEQSEWLARSGKLLLLAQASVRLTGRHATLVRLREPTDKSPWFAAGGVPPLRIADRDATYGLDLDLYAEDVPGRAGHAAISAVATVRRPDRARPVMTSAGLVRIPVFLAQAVEADRLVPHAGSLLLTGLVNPFRATGAGGDAAGGTHPDLVVLVSAFPAAAGGAPDIAPPSPPPPAVPSTAGGETREYALGPLGTSIEDEPPPEDWPLTPYGDAARPGAARAQRDAFLGGLLADRAGLSAASGVVLVREGRATAVLPPAGHVRLAREIETLSRDEGRLFAIEVRAVEVAADRATAWLAEAGARADDPAQRVWRLAPEGAARLEERLRSVTDPGGLYALEARLAAGHTQLVTTRSIRSRSLVTEFRVVDRGDGELQTLPVNGTAEEGIVVGVRPLASVGGLAVLYVNAVLGRIERVDAWTPPDAPGDAPEVSLPRHQVERAAGAGAIAERDTMLLAVPAPGSAGERVVLVRARHAPPR